MPIRPPVFKMPGSGSSPGRRASIMGERRGTPQERGYDATWKKLSFTFRQAHPFCAMCLEQGISTRAALVDHIATIEDRPDLRLEWSNLQSLCRPCHKFKTWAIDMAGRAQARPPWLKPASMPTRLICGPPGSGKSTQATRMASRDDLVIDLDVIACQVLGVTFTHDWDRSGLDRALHVRNRLLGQLSIRPPHWPNAFVIVGAPSPMDRLWWGQALMVTETIVCETPAHVCYQRVSMRSETSKRIEHTRLAISSWWDTYERGQNETYV